MPKESNNTEFDSLDSFCDLYSKKYFFTRSFCCLKPRGAINGVVTVEDPFQKVHLKFQVQ